MERNKISQQTDKLDYESAIKFQRVWVEIIHAVSAL